MQAFQEQAIIKMHKTEYKIIRKKTRASTIKQNSRNSEIMKKQTPRKGQHSILQLNRRLSSNSLNKKTEQIFNFLSKMPKKDKHLMTAQIKCFMLGKHTHDSHLVDIKITNNALQKIRNHDRFQLGYSFNDCILKRCGDSQILLATYQQCMRQQYPPTVSFMLIYFGIFLYSINSQYNLAEKYTQKLFDIIVRYKVQQFFIIYLLLKIKLRTNLSEWQDALTLLTKLVVFSWLYNLTDLQIWCYFELSRVYFFMQKSKESQIFKIKSQTNSSQPKRSIYRQVLVSNLILQIQSIWEGQLDFKCDRIIDESRLSLPQSMKYGVQQYVADQRKLKTNIKGIIQDCKIRHVGNLLTRMGQINMHNVQKQYQKQNMYMANTTSTMASTSSNFNSSNGGKVFGNSSSNISVSSIGNSYINSHGVSIKSGNNFLLTHQSYNKNMNMFFRKRNSQNQHNQRVFYTIENSIKNWSALKEMLRNIFIQMTYYTANIHV